MFYLFISSCSNNQASTQTDESESSIKDANVPVAKGDVLDLDIKIFSFPFSGTVEITSLDQDGKFGALLKIKGFGAQIVTGSLSKEQVSLNNFRIHSGEVTEFSGIADSKGNMDGSFIYFVGIGFCLCTTCCNAPLNHALISIISSP